MWPDPNDHHEVNPFNLYLNRLSGADAMKERNRRIRQRQECRASALRTISAFLCRLEWIKALLHVWNAERLARMARLTRMVEAWGNAGDRIFAKSEPRLFAEWVRANGLRPGSDERRLRLWQQWRAEVVTA